MVPKKIDDLLKTNKDEIKFIISSKTLSYKTFVRHIPVPISNEKFPYRARATMCYFPGCRRDQGVDYTDTELDIRFGRVQKSKSGFGIKSIDNNVQLDEMVTEADAREYYRK
ncbi:MAG: hypothetical protein MJ217_02685 [Bacilli bacterium]|nr:hypothetical protein [Bacilli bacterium]